MICTVCYTNYHPQTNNWEFQGITDKGEGMYIIQSDVFLPGNLEQILEHALQNEINEVFVDTCLTEIVFCEGCFLLTIRLGRERHNLLNLTKYQNINYYEYF